MPVNKFGEFRVQRLPIATELLQRFLACAGDEHIGIFEQLVKYLSAFIALQIEHHETLVHSHQIEAGVIEIVSSWHAIHIPVRTVIVP